jgi:hypothetical protein
MRIECSNVVETDVRNSKSRERSTPQVAVQAAPGRSDQTAAGTPSSAVPICTITEPSFEDNSLYTIQSDQSSSLSQTLDREDIDIKQINDCFAR